MGDPLTENQRLTRVEEHVAHQQRLLDELNAVVTSQQRELDALKADHGRLANTVARLVELYEAAEDTPDNNPPHY